MSFPKYVMRYNQILFEYVRDVSVEKFHAVLYDRLSRDTSFQHIWTSYLNSDNTGRPQGMSLKEMVGRKCAKFFLQACEEADPTQNNSYVLWIVRTYLKGGIRLYEDIRSTVADALDDYDEIKRAGFFRRTTDEMLKPLSDINRIHNLMELRGVINSVPIDQRISNAAADKKIEQDLISNGEAEILVDTAECRVLIPHTEKAAIYFGRNTQWCTSAKRNNMFQSYNKDGPLFIVLDKQNNRRWQFHPSTAQFMDENDLEMDRMDWDQLPKAALAIDEPYRRATRMASRHHLKAMENSDFQPFSRMAFEKLRAFID